jgi:histidinol-phosphatase (PHP family)
MREIVDCHIHTAACGHAVGCAEEYVTAARAAGVSTLVFTEHLPLPPELDPHRHLALAPDDLERYAEEILTLSATTTDLTVVCGAEVDWLPGHEEFSLAAIAQAQAAGIVVLMGSVHFLDTWAFDDPHDLARWDSVDVDEIYNAYFTRWYDAVTSGRFDVMAHPDLPKKFGHRPLADPAPLYRQAAAVASAAGVAIEVSTAGLRKPVGELYPAPALLAAFADAGVRATAGSDAHAPEEVGYRIDAAYDAMLSAGYTAVVCPDGGGSWREIPIAHP